MSKEKKGNSAFKKSIALPDKKSFGTTSIKLDNKKVEIISTKIAQMNKRFEGLIEECKMALNRLNDNQPLKA